LGRTEYYAPLVVVQIVAGILLGPGVLGAAFPTYYSFVFNPQVIQALNGVAWWAVMLFVMIAGLELDLSRYGRTDGKPESRRVWRSACRCSAERSSRTALMFDGWKGDGAAAWQFILGVGMSCAVTALPILVLLMEKMGILRERIGQRILRYATWTTSRSGAARLDPDGLDQSRAPTDLHRHLYSGRQWTRAIMRRIPERDRMVCLLDLAGRLRVWRRLVWLAFHGWRFLAGASLDGIGLIRAHGYHASQRPACPDARFLSSVPDFALHGRWAGEMCFCSRPPCSPHPSSAN
jgi:hypothetical protein